MTTRLPLSHTVPGRAIGFAGRDTLAVGDFVRHRGTKDWGEIESIDLRRDGTAELVLLDRNGGRRYWATYHLDYHIACGARVEKN